VNHLISVRELIQRTEKQFSNANLFYGHGTDNALDEAFYLVMAAAGLEFDCNEEELDKPIEQTILNKIENLIEKRITQRIPVAYLVNQAWFAGRKFYVDERVLIPRSPFAELITSQFMPWITYDKVKSILDIGTGGACIPIACAYEFSDATIDAVDIDDDAIDVANKNVSLHELEDRVHVIKSNLFEQLDGKKYDLIISNPPYVGHDEMQSLPKEYRHEPSHALEANDNGLELVGAILKQASQHLNDGGILAVEVGNSKEALIEYYPELPFIWLEFEHGGEGVFILNKSDLV
jgi:ribosomal protein L3 glutamine methyltransferase